MRLQLYNAFKSFSHSKDFWNEWRFFANAAQVIINEDRNLKELLSENQFLSNNWEKIKQNVFMSIDTDLIDLAYYDAEDLNSFEPLFDKVISIFNNSVANGFINAYRQPDLQEESLINPTYYCINPL